MDIQAVILAAGFSSRAKTYKMQLNIAGKPVLARCIETFCGICSQIFVVAGYKAKKIFPITEKYPKVTVIENKDFELGMFSSVKAGVSKIHAERFFITPGDCPIINEKVCKCLLGSKKEIVIPTYRGKHGHPVLLNGSCAEEIRKEPYNSNLKKYFSRKKCGFVDVEDIGILLDIDTMEDYQNVCRFIERKYPK